MTRSPSWLISRPGLRVSRLTWAVAGSLNRPNSARSPPLENDGPAPRRSTVSAASRTADGEGVGEHGSQALVHGVVPPGPVERDRQPVAVTLDEDGRLDVGRNDGVTLDRSHAANSGPACKSEYTADSAASPSSTVACGVRTQVDGERGRRERVLADVRQHDVEPRVVGSDDDVARARRVRRVPSIRAHARRRRRRDGSPATTSGGSSASSSTSTTGSPTAAPSSSAAVNQLAASSELPSRRGGVVAIGEPYRRPRDGLPA